MNIREVGSGSGLIYQTLKDIGLVTSKTYRGGDVSERMLEIARNRAPDVEFLKLDIFGIALPDRSQDNVICIHVLQHLPGFEAAVSELVRITKNKLYIASWFVAENDDQVTFCDASTDWDNQSFFNNY